jgi:hypothetical protein
LLLCVQTALHGDRPAELQATGRLAAQKVEDRLQDMQREVRSIDPNSSWLSPARQPCPYKDALRLMVEQKDKK